MEKQFAFAASRALDAGTWGPSRGLYPHKAPHAFPEASALAFAKASFAIHCLESLKRRDILAPSVIVRSGLPIELEHTELEHAGISYSALPFFLVAFFFAFAAFRFSRRVRRFCSTTSSFTRSTFALKRDAYPT